MDVQRGMVVAGPEGRIGVVSDVVNNTNTGGSASGVTVQRDDGQTMLLQQGSYTMYDGVVRLSGAVSNSGVAEQTQSGGRIGFETQRITDEQVRDVRPGEPVIVPILEEQLNVGTRVIERGGVRVHKTIAEHEETVEQPVFREEVTVERVPIGRVVESVPEARQEGETLIIPVVEEMLVVEKRLVLKEEVRVQKRRIEETEQVRAMVRSEKVEIEQIADPSVHGPIGDRTGL